MQFLTMTLLQPLLVDWLEIHNTVVFELVFVFSMVRFLELVPLFEPSMVMKSAPFNLSIATDEAPVIDLFTEVSGFIVTLFESDDP